MSVAVRAAAEPTGPDAPVVAPAVVTTPAVAPVVAPVVTPAVTPAVVTAPVVAPIVAPLAPVTAAFDHAAMDREIASTGKPSDATLAKLKSAGFDDAFVNSLVEGRKATQTANRAALLKNVGGEEGFTKAADWAKANLPKAELDAFNRAINNTDGTAVQFAVEGLVSRFRAANPAEPNLLGGSNGAGNTSFQNTAQIREAMNDPRYATDASYRKGVEDRLRYSKAI
jgi:hypothetical protein